jgi:hypothetical protein
MVGVRSGLRHADRNRRRVWEITDISAEEQSTRGYYLMGLTARTGASEERRGSRSSFRFTPQ